MANVPDDHRDVGQRQAEDLNDADWNQREGSQADPDAETETERQKKAASSRND